MYFYNSPYVESIDNYFACTLKAIFTDKSVKTSQKVFYRFTVQLD